MKTIIASLAAASLAFVPLAAQANTRSAESSVSLVQTYAPARTASPVGEAEDLEGLSPLILILGGILVVWGVIEIVDSKGIID